MRISDWSSDVCSSDLEKLLPRLIVPEPANSARGQVYRERFHNRDVVRRGPIALIASAPAQAQERVFDVPAQPAIDAIPEFARQAEIKIVAPARDLEGILTPEIKGRKNGRANV